MKNRIKAKTKSARNDVYQNFGTGLGVSGIDKAIGTSYVPAIRRTRHELESLFRYDWLSRKICLKPAHDALHPFVSKIGDSEKIDEFIVSSGVKDVFTSALAYTNLFGGAAVLFVYPDGQDSETPLEYKEGVFLDSLIAVDRWCIHPLDSSDVNTCEYFRVNQQVWHKSRVCLISGGLLSSAETQRESGWGCSVLDSVGEAIQSLMVQYQNVSHILQEQSMGIIKVRGFANAGRGGAILQAISARLDTLNTSKSIYRTLMLDEAESYDNVNRPLNGLSEVTDMFVTQVSAASGIPESVLFGKHISGMSANSDNQVEVYNETVEALRHSLDTAVSKMFLLLGEPDFSWSWQKRGKLKPSEIADIRLKNAQALAIEMETLQLSDTEARMLTKKADFHGLYADLECE